MKFSILGVDVKVPVVGVAIVITLVVFLGAAVAGLAGYGITFGVAELFQGNTDGLKPFEFFQERQTYNEIAIGASLVFYIMYLYFVAPFISTDE